MLTRTLSIGAVAIAWATSAALAAGLTEELQTGRMTVVKVDREAGRFLCAEHGKWTTAVKPDLWRVEPGDIVRVERGESTLVRVVLLRTAADELTSPEK